MPAYIIPVDDVGWSKFTEYAVLKVSGKIRNIFKKDDLLFVVKNSNSTLHGPFYVKYEKPDKYCRKCDCDQVICRSGDKAPGWIPYAPISELEYAEDFMVEVLMQELSSENLSDIEKDEWVSGNAELDGLLIWAEYKNRTDTLCIDFSCKSEKLKGYYLELINSCGHDAYIDKNGKIQIRSKYLTESISSILLERGLLNREFLNGFLAVQIMPIANNMSVGAPKEYEYALAVSELCADYNLVDNCDCPVFITEGVNRIKISPLFADEHPFCLAVQQSEELVSSFDTVYTHRLEENIIVDQLCFTASYEILKRIFTLCGYSLSEEMRLDNGLAIFCISKNEESFVIYAASSCNEVLYGHLINTGYCKGMDNVFVILLNNYESQNLKIISKNAAYSYLCSENPQIPEHLKFNLENCGYLELIDGLVSEMNWKIYDIWKVRYG